jgi:hypothetical protein
VVAGSTTASIEAFGRSGEKCETRRVRTNGVARVTEEGESSSGQLLSTPRSRRMGGTATGAGVSARARDSAREEDEGCGGLASWAGLSALRTQAQPD